MFPTAGICIAVQTLFSRQFRGTVEVDPGSQHGAEGNDATHVGISAASITLLLPNIGLDRFHGIIFAGWRAASRSMHHAINTLKSTAQPQITNISDK